MSDSDKIERAMLLTKKEILSQGKTYKHLERPDIQSGVLSSLTFSSVYLDCISFDETYFKKCSFINVEFSGCLISDVVFEDCSFANVEFYGCYGFRSAFKSCEYSNLKVLGGNFSKAKFDRHAEKEISFLKDNLGSLANIEDLSFVKFE